jgi:hypothetical protein
VAEAAASDVLANKPSMTGGLKCPLGWAVPVILLESVSRLSACSRMAVQRNRDRQEADRRGTRFEITRPFRYHKGSQGFTPGVITPSERGGNEMTETGRLFSARVGYRRERSIQLPDLDVERLVVGLGAVLQHT